MSWRKRTPMMKFNDDLSGSLGRMKRLNCKDSELATKDRPVGNAHSIDQLITKSYRFNRAAASAVDSRRRKLMNAENISE